MYSYEGVSIRTVVFPQYLLPLPLPSPPPPPLLSPPLLFHPGHTPLSGPIVADQSRDKHQDAAATLTDATPDLSW